MKTYLSALLLGLSAIVHAQYKVVGTVTDANQNPLPGVSVYSPDVQKGTVTDDSGNYTLLNLPARPIRVLFSFIGYVGQQQRIDVSSSPVLNIILEQSVHQMDEVIVSTAFNKMQSQNVMKVDHTSIKTLQQHGTATLAEGLATIPGVSQISTGTSIGKPVIRGLSGNRVLVYSQGVRLENQQFGSEHGLGLNDSGVESVEVIKGPASLLYGSDALGGVLYFNPEKFASSNSSEADFNQRFFSNTLGSNSTLGYKTSNENWKFLFRGNYATHADYQIPNGDRVANSRFNEIDLKSAVGFSNSKMSSVFRYNFNNLDIGLPEGDYSESTNRKTMFPKQHVQNHIASLHNTFFFARSSIDMSIGYILNDRQEFEDSDDAALRMKLETINYDLKYHFPTFAKIDLIAGIQGMHQTNRNFADELLIPDATTNDFGVFATAMYEWKSNAVQAGLRFDNRQINSAEHGDTQEEGYFEALSTNYNSYTVSFGYKKQFNDQLTLRTNFASGFRAPNLAELTSNGVHEGTNRYEIGNSALSTEQNYQYDLNLEYKNSHFEFFVNGFYNHINDYIYTSPTGATLDDNAVFEYVQQDARLYGGEAAVHFHPHPLDWLHFESSFETVIGEQQNGDNLALIPANNWSNTIRTEFKIREWLSDGFVKVNLSSTFSQNNVSQFETTTPQYSLFNAGFGGKFKLGTIAFEASVNGNNLFDKSYIAHLSRLKPDGIPNIGRNIVMDIRFKI